FLVCPGTDKLSSRLQCVDKRRASRGKIKSPHFFDSKLVLHQARRRREQHVGSDGRHHNRLYFVTVNAAFSQSALGRFYRQIAGRDAICHNVTLANASAADYPFIRSFYDPLEVSI